jgi:probable DNA metabolism protein
MPVITLARETDWDGWRTAARALRLGGVPPDDVAWRVSEGDLFSEDDSLPTSATPPFTVPPTFIDLAKDAICHRSDDRFALLYRLLWRLRDEPALMGLRTDPDVDRALDMQKAVRRASHKMKAFVRFRQVADVVPETYVAWFEPPHRVLERTADFFVRRFANVRFSILTPDLSCHWDGESLAFETASTRADAPAEDELEDFWRTYYASIFNPARLKVRAMTSEMPKQYWRNLPEASLIPGLIEDAERRMTAMVETAPTTPARRLPVAPALSDPIRSGDDTLPAIAAALDQCRRCDLWRDATQGVPGDGPARAEMMLVGEQPGDVEDLAGKPFVGPAGQMLDRALAEAGVARAQLYVTNAVKHFKHELRGKRRLHKTPEAGEIAACRWWLDKERALVAPRVVVALGGTAALAVLGRAMPILKSRGRVFDLDDGARATITVHPSYLLRLPDERAKAEAYARFVQDLAAARALLG